jgi:hypothetical protein
VAQVVKHLLCKYNEALTSNPGPTKKTEMQKLKTLYKTLLKFLIIIKLGSGELMPIILDTWEAEIRRIMVRGQLVGQIVCKPSSPKRNR